MTFSIDTDRDSAAFPEFRGAAGVRAHWSRGREHVWDMALGAV